MWALDYFWWAACISIHNDCPSVQTVLQVWASFISHIWALPLASTASPWCGAVLQGACAILAWLGYGQWWSSLWQRLELLLVHCCVSASGDCLCLTLAAPFWAASLCHSWALSSALATHAPVCTVSSGRQVRHLYSTWAEAHVRVAVCSFQHPLLGSR